MLLPSLAPKVGLLMGLASKSSPQVECSDPAGAAASERFGDVERWATVFDDPARDAWQMPSAVVALLQRAAPSRVSSVMSVARYLRGVRCAARGVRGGSSYCALRVRSAWIELRD